MLLYKIICVLLNLYICVVLSDHYEESSTYSSVPCAARKSISPCTCEKHRLKDIWVTVICHKMESFSQVIDALRNKFERDLQIQLKIEYSNLEDMKEKSFSQIATNIFFLWLAYNNATELPHESFKGIFTVKSLVLIESKVNGFPGTIFSHMPKMEVISIERTSIKSISPADFQSLEKLRILTITACNLTFIENNTFPPLLNKLNLRQNNISTLNHTIRNNFELEWVLLSNNNIDSLDEQLPDYKPNHKLIWIDMGNNKLKSIPQSFQNLKTLKSFSAGMNNIENLNNSLSALNELTHLDLDYNKINQVSSNEFEKCIKLRHINLSYNEIRHLNFSLRSLKSLEFINLTYNKLTSFSIDEIKGLTKIKLLDLSYNKITKVIGKLKEESVLAENISVEVLRLEGNKLEVLEGSFASVQGLKQINISDNKLTAISPEFFKGLDELQILDVSYNHLHSLLDASKAILPSLGYLYASHNKIPELSRDSISGFSAACFLHLEYNKIKAIKSDFAEKNQCIYNPGVNATLHVYLEGNEVLCKDTIKETISEVESKSKTTINGHCTKMPNEELKYNVNNSDSSPITVVTLDG